MKCQWCEGKLQGRTIDLSDKAIERFWSRVERSGRSACWRWKGGVTTNGYGRFYYGGKKYEAAHRVAYIMEYGCIPKNLPFVLHACDNKLCVNPDHLSVGTPADNMIDKMAKKRPGPPSYLGFPRGVGKQPVGGRYFAYARHRGKYIYLGTHDTPEIASAAAEAKRRELVREWGGLQKEPCQCRGGKE